MARDHKSIVDQYIADIQAGRIVVGELVRATVDRHLKDLKQAGKRGYYFDESIAAHSCDWFPLLKHATGEFAGKPFVLESWQTFAIWVLFGWRRKSDDLRRFKHCFWSMGRGNGKSPIGAGLATKLWAADEPIEPRAEVYTAATRKKQARIVWDEAKRYVNGLPSLKKRVQTFDSTLGTRMVLTTNDSTLEVLEYSASGHDGQVIHAAVIDELHAWRPMHRTLLDNIDTAMSKRRQPLRIIITTAGGEESTLWEGEYNYAVSVVRGQVPADDYFVLIYQLDEKDDIHDEAVWPKANPNLGVSVKVDGLRALSAKAKIDPETRRVFRRYHCNLKTTSLSRAIPAELWAKGDEPLPALDGLACHGGIDIGWRDDLAAFTCVFPIEWETDEGDPTTLFAAKCWAWLPRDGKRDLSREPWASWINEGWLTVTDGNVTDPEAIYAAVELAQKRYELRTVAMDPNNARALSVHILNNMGIPTFDFQQTARKYNEPIRECLKSLHEGRFVHGGNPLLAWCASNLVTRADANEYLMPDKNKSAEKIDPMVALFMAYSECLYGADEGPGAYGDGGGVVLL